MTRIKEQILDFITDGLWTDGVGLFFRYWKNWFVGFWVFVGIDVLASPFLHDVLPLFWDKVFYTAIGVAQVYFFCVCFLQQEPVTGVIVVSVRAFIRSFGYLLLPFLVLGGVGSACDLVPLNDVSVKLIMSYFAVYFLCVAPLAMNGIAAPLATNWRFVRGKFARVWINIITIFLLFAPCYLMAPFWQENSGADIFYSIVDVIRFGIFSAFACATTKILYGEDMAARYGDRRGAVRV